MVSNNCFIGADFTACACTPIRAISSFICWDSCIVKITILEFGSAARINRAASSPPITDMLISRIIRSGFSSVAFATASLPFITSAQTSQPAADRAERKPRRTASWSSAIKILIGFFRPETRASLSPGESKPLQKRCEEPFDLGSKISAELPAILSPTDEERRYFPNVVPSIRRFKLAEEPDGMQSKTSYLGLDQSILKNL